MEATTTRTERAVRCAGKIKRSLPDARRAARALSQKCGVLVEPYWCRFCAAYHVGNKPGTRKWRH